MSCSEKKLSREEAKTLLIIEADTIIKEHESPNTFNLKTIKDAREFLKKIYETEKSKGVPQLLLYEIYIIAHTPEDKIRTFQQLKPNPSGEKSLGHVGKNSTPTLMSSLDKLASKLF